LRKEIVYIMIDQGYYTLNDVRMNVSLDLFKFWMPIVVTVDSHEPFIMYRGDTLTIAQPNCNFSKFHKFLAWLHGVKLYNEG